MAPADLRSAGTPARVIGALDRQRQPGDDPGQAGLTVTRLSEIADIASAVLVSKLFVTVTIPADAISIGTRLGWGVHIRERPTSCSGSSAA